MGTPLGPRYILYSYIDPLGGWQGLWWVQSRSFGKVKVMMGLEDVDFIHGFVLL